MLLGTEVGLGPGDIMLDGDPAPQRKGAQHPPPHFSAHVYCGQIVAISATAELLLFNSRVQSHGNSPNGEFHGFMGKWDHGLEE